CSRTRSTRWWWWPRSTSRRRSAPRRACRSSGSASRRRRRAGATSSARGVSTSSAAPGSRRSRGSRSWSRCWRSTWWATRCATCSIPVSRANSQPFVQRAEDLRDSGVRPQVEEGRLEQGRDVAAAARLHLLVRLARARRAQVADHAVLAIDGRVLDVAVQLHEVLREEGSDGDRGELLPLLLVRVLEHQIGV